MLTSMRSIFILLILLTASKYSIAGDNKILQLRCKDCFAPRFSSELLDLKGKEYEKRFSEPQNPLHFQDSSDFIFRYKVRDGLEIRDNSIFFDSRSIGEVEINIAPKKLQFSVSPKETNKFELEAQPDKIFLKFKFDF